MFLLNLPVWVTCIFKCKNKEFYLNAGKQYKLTWKMDHEFLKSVIAKLPLISISPHGGAKSSSVLCLQSCYEGTHTHTLSHTHMHANNFAHLGEVKKKYCSFKHGAICHLSKTIQSKKYCCLKKKK